MSRRWRIVLMLGVALAGGLWACGGSPSGDNGTATVGTPHNCGQGTLTISSSPVLSPLGRAVSGDFQKRCPGATLKIKERVMSKFVLSDVEQGSAQVGLSDAPALDSQKDLIDHQTTVILFALVINSKVQGVTNLTTRQIQGIYNGSITNWKDLGGPDLPIVVVSRPPSAVRSKFERYVLGGPETLTTAVHPANGDNPTAASVVQKTDGAISYMILRTAQDYHLSLLAIDGSPSSADAVKNNTYHFWNIGHLYTKGKPSDLAQALINSMSSDVARDEGAKIGLLRASDVPQDILSAHQL